MSAFRKVCRDLYYNFALVLNLNIYKRIFSTTRIKRQKVEIFYKYCYYDYSLTVNRRLHAHLFYRTSNIYSVLQITGLVVFPVFVLVTNPGCRLNEIILYRANYFHSHRFSLT